MTATIILPFILSCNNPAGNENQEQKLQDNIAKVLSKPGSSFRDSLTIKSSAAVFYHPDSMQRKKIITANKQSAFESLEHEYFFQMRNARIVLKKYWPKIQIIESSHARYLVFVKTDQSKFIIDLDNKNDMSGIFLFDAKKDPQFIDMMNIDTALEFYFNDK